MAAKQINYYVENKYTEDIVYPYNNGEVDRYRKTEQSVLLIHKNKNGKITQRLLAEYEFPLHSLYHIAHAAFHGKSKRVCCGLLCESGGY